MKGTGGEGIGESPTRSTDADPEEARVGDVTRDVLAREVEPNLENHRRIPAQNTIKHFDLIYNNFIMKPKALIFLDLSNKQNRVIGTLLRNR